MVFLIHTSQLNHADQCLMVYTPMILHNVFVVEGENKWHNWRALLCEVVVNEAGLVQDLQLTQCRVCQPQKGNVC
jgi:hypothetical protein